jgi:hypothetical protein
MSVQYPPPLDITYYVAGPISGSMMSENLKKFVIAVRELRERGYTVVSPVEIHDAADVVPDTAKDWTYYLRKDIEALVHDDVKGIILLPGWEFSMGTNLELQIALKLNYYVTTLGECLGREPKVSL